MTVVADTTPLRYLVVIQCEHLLPALYGRILIPPAVAQELNRPSTPELVRQWLANRPDWLDVRPLAKPLLANTRLQLGEREAIALAGELAADLLLMDDWRAREEAARHQLQVVGTLRVLADAADRNLINLSEAFERLRGTNFRVNPQLFEALLNEYRRIRGDL
jgi:predicted nucleic acid-binding protein